MNSITAKIFDVTRGSVCSQFLDMCTITEAIFSKMNQVLSSCVIPWGNCVWFGVDNASVN